MDTIWQNLRYALRQVLTEKAFFLPAVITLMLGIGAAVTLFTVINAVLLRDLPYEAPERLVEIEGQMTEKGEVHSWPISLLDFSDWRKRSTSYSAMSVWGSFAFNLEQGDQSQRLWGELVNDSYLSLLGLRPQLGRFFIPDEDARPMEQYVVVIGDGLWRKTFGADPRILGRKIRLNGRLYEVIGVGPKGFRGLSDKADLWVPSMLTPIKTFVTTRNVRWASGVARLKPGVTVQQAQEELNGITAQLGSEVPEAQGMGATITPIDTFWFGKLRIGLLVLSVGACILLLIACINVACLLMTRAVARQRDWAIRVVLGARRGVLVRQMLTESLVLSLIGAAAGLLLAQWASRAQLAASGIELPSFVRVGTGPEVIALTLGLVVFCSLLFGLAPIWVSFRTDLTRSLGREEKLPPRSKSWHLIQNLVVIAQVALALTLSISAMLMAQGFRRMIGEDLGFKADNVLTFRMDMRDPQHLDSPAVVKMLREIYLPRISAVPGVRKAALSVPTMPTDEWAVAEMTIEDHDNPDTHDGTYVATVHAITPEFFDVLRIPLDRGRDFTRQDVQSNSVIVSRALAQRQWPGQNPLGKRLKIAVRGRQEVPWLSVVGVAAPVIHEGFQEDRAPAPDVYLCLLQFLRRPLTVNFLLQPQPGVSLADLRPALEKEMKAINPELPAYDMSPLEDRLVKQTSRARFLVILISTFALLALILAAVGVYGVISYSASQRRREIAIRVSLGATQGSILRMIVVRGAMLAAVGLALGLIAVYVLGRLLSTLLYQTSATDPLILAGTSLGLFLVTLAANYLPARRAAILDPMSGLRQ